MRPTVWKAWEQFQEAGEARGRDLHNPAKAAALIQARSAFEESLVDVLARVSYRTRRVGDLRPGRDGGHVHLATTSDIAVQGFRRSNGQTLCGAAGGRPNQARPITCGACLRVVERHVDLEQDPPELPLLL